MEQNEKVTISLPQDKASQFHIKTHTHGDIQMSSYVFLRDIQFGDIDLHTVTGYIMAMLTGISTIWESSRAKEELRSKIAMNVKEGQ
jgi:hypothetical protein